MMLPRLKKSNCILLLLGTLIQAIGIYNIHSLSNVTEGGVLGLTLLIRHWLGISPAVSSLFLNLCCYAFGWKTLGKDFVGYSLLSIAGVFSAPVAGNWQLSAAGCPCRSAVYRHRRRSVRPCRRYDSR